MITPSNEGKRQTKGKLSRKEKMAVQGRPIKNKRPCSTPVADGAGKPVPVDANAGGSDASPAGDPKDLPAFRQNISEILSREKASTVPCLGAGIWMRKAPLLVVLVLSGILFLATLIQLHDPDTWWLLATGKLFFLEGIPKTNTVSFSNPDYPWPNSYWLFSAILRIAELAGGAYGVQCVPILFAFAAFFVVADTTLLGREKKNWFLFMLLMALAVMVSRFRYVPRPHVVSILGLAILYNLWARQPRRFLVWTGLLAVVWANLHAGVVFGSVGFLPLILGSALQKDWGRLKKGLSGLAIFFLCSLLNVDFAYAYTYTFSHLWKFDALRINIAEQNSPNTRDFRLHYVLVALGLVAVLPRIRAKDFTCIAVAATWLLFSLKAIYGIPYFAIAALPGMYAGWDDLLRWLREVVRRQWVMWGLAGVACVAVVILAIGEVNSRGEDYKFGFGINERQVAMGASDFIEKTGLTGNMYNCFGDGGFLIWRLFPHRKVLQDGRTQAYPDDFLKALNAEGFHRKLLPFLDSYQVQYAVVSRQPNSFDRTNIFLAAGWPLIYLDGVNAIFAKPGVLDMKTMAQVQFLTIPCQGDVELSGADPGLQKKRVVYELNRIDPERLIEAKDFMRFAIAAKRIGENMLAEKFFKAGIAYLPKELSIKFEYGNFLTQNNRSQEGLPYLREVARKGQNSEIGVLAKKTLERIQSVK